MVELLTCRDKRRTRRFRVPIEELLKHEGPVIQKPASNPQDDDVEVEHPIFQAVQSNDRPTLETHYSTLDIEASSIVATESCRNDLLLHRAVRCGHYYMVEYLLEKIVSKQLNTRKRDGATPLFLAAQEGHCDLVHLLINSGASLYIPDEDGISPLYIASYQGHGDIVQILLDAGADPNQRGKDSTSPLYIAAQEGYAQIVRMLAERGADINAPDRDGTTPLLMSSQEGRTSAVATLLSFGADVEAATGRGVRPVHSAAQNGHLKILQLLTAYGADVRVTTNYSGTTALRLARDFGHRDVVNWLVGCTSGMSRIVMCAEARLYWVAEQLFEDGNGDREIMESPSDIMVQALHCANLKKNPCLPTAKLFRRALGLWTPATHYLFGPGYRKTVWTLLLIRQRGLLKVNANGKNLYSQYLPYEMWLAVVAQLPRASFEHFYTDKAAKVSAIDHEELEEPMTPDLNEETLDPEILVL